MDDFCIYFHLFIGLGIGDLVNFYIDPNVIAKPYDAVACNVDVLKHADVPKPPTEKKVRFSRNFFL